VDGMARRRLERSKGVDGGVGTVAGRSGDARRLFGAAPRKEERRGRERERESEWQRIEESHVLSRSRSVRLSGQPRSSRTTRRSPPSQTNISPTPGRLVSSLSFSPFLAPSFGFSPSHPATIAARLRRRRASRPSCC
jgi:hypothetical protein